MSVFDDLVESISNCMPRFNKFALVDFVKESIDDSPNFVASIFEEGFKLIDADLKYMDYTILPPEEQVKFELRSNKGKVTKPKIPLTFSHLRLIQYRFKFENEFIYARIYTPYMFNNMLHIKDKRSMIRKVILEKTFSRITGRDRDGISVSPIRVNLRFNRLKTHKIKSYTSDQTYMNFIITGKLYNGAVKKKICETTIVHYMLAKFGLNDTLKKFGISKNDILFVTEIKDDTNKFEYFTAKKLQDNPDLFLKVKKSLLTQDQPLKFVINLMYVLEYFDKQTIDNIYAKEVSIWKIILGLITSDNDSELRAFSHAETHIKSADTFMDPITIDRFRRFGIMINDIYDLLVYIFINIDEFMVKTQVQDLYNNRLDVSNGLLVGSFATKIYNGGIYSLGRTTNINLNTVKQALRFDSMLFKTMSGGKNDDAKHYVAPPEIVSDNFLLSGGLNKIRLEGKAEQRLHPSMLVAESVNALVGKYIGKTGYLNPYIPLDKNGAIEHPAYSKSIDLIIPYLPK